ncbi:chemotaxis protein MotB [Thermoflavifilum aggregans]|uniref:Chemotaxis protein MotB n=1 Tax=Thermoflavifilum aggregans TaxID=454188 RepID=A0A2M9CVG0_9BACT|nr:flagellar motor protein MotB [Thermoflavifilum aggregans]PJJ75906.1 chemotaxis protein MotB [Thermoflavifilum aggregans]
MNSRWILVILWISLMAGGCVSQKKYVEARLHLANLLQDSLQLSHQLQICNDTVAGLRNQLADVNDQLQRYIQAAAIEISSKQKQIQSSQALIQQQQQRLAEQQQQLVHLQQVLRQQHALMDSIRNSIARALMGFKSDELSVQMQNGRVYVSLQEKLLFKSGSAVVEPKGVEALARLAQVLNQHPDLDIDVEGHTDSIPIHGRYPDNWALSLARAASVTRILINDYHVSPLHITASGRSWYDPVDTNSTPEGRARNRRTEIIITPKLDELFRLIEQNGEPPATSQDSGSLSP